MKHGESKPESDNQNRLVRAIEFGAGAALFGTVLAIVKNREMAEDVVQVTYEKALKRIDKFRGDSWIETWLHRIAINTAFDTLKSKSRTDVLDDEIIYSRESLDADPVSAAIGAEEWQEVIDQIQQLSPNHQKEFFMFMAGFSYQEIADELGKELSTVKVNIHRARKKLKKLQDEQKTPRKGEF